MNYKKMIKNGLNARDCYVLEKLLVCEACPSELADSLISTASITMTSNKLVKKRLITRVNDKDDRRKVIMTITKKGKEAIS